LTQSDTISANGQAQTSDTRSKLLEVKNLKKWFPIKRGFFSRTVGHVKAVDGVSFYVREGETLGLVGESAVARPRQAA
jgi:ABC-type microcin C transport system duplicated ATPase subunit YejF